MKLTYSTGVHSVLIMCLNKGVRGLGNFLYIKTPYIMYVFIPSGRKLGTPSSCQQGRIW
jgi:hypothetical protein